MSASRDFDTLIVPAENQARELDPKILLCCVAARSGFTSIIGSRTEVDHRLASFPRGFYLAKSMTRRSRRVFGFLLQLGHEIAAWDEESAVRYDDPEIYYARRLSPETMGRVSRLFAWGESDAELFRAYPGYHGAPIHVTGNPRGDLLRSELHPYYADEVDALRARYGAFVLINTNFAHVNAFRPLLNLLLPAQGEGPRPLGRGATGMSRAYAEGRAAHKQAVFESFLDVIPRLHEALPDHQIVVRPHPVEHPTVYERLAAPLERVHVEPAGDSIIPWLLAAGVLIHNSCTTGFEACAVGTPVVAYRRVANERYEETLPNRLSLTCGDPEELAEVVGKILSGGPASVGGESRRALLDHHVAALDGPLASERIVRVLAERRAGGAPSSPPLPQRAAGWARATSRRVVKTVKSRLPGAKNPPAFQRHRYPGAALDDMRQRVARFQELLGSPDPLRVERISAHVYRISP